MGFMVIRQEFKKFQMSQSGAKMENMLSGLLQQVPTSLDLSFVEFVKVWSKNEHLD